MTERNREKTIAIVTIPAQVYIHMTRDHIHIRGRMFTYIKLVRSSIAPPFAVASYIVLVDHGTLFTIKEVRS